MGSERVSDSKCALARTTPANPQLTSLVRNVTEQLARVANERTEYQVRARQTVRARSRSPLPAPSTRHPLSATARQTKYGIQVVPQEMARKMQAQQQQERERGDGDGDDGADAGAAPRSAGPGVLA